ncbi:MAG: hypothetical protein K1W24_15305 [Lachnospiraceae bacterium]
MQNKEIQWHPPFKAAICLEIAKDGITIEAEHTLNTGAIKIDLLATCGQNTYNNNEICQIFKEYNIIEYKNPYDSLSPDTYIKVLGYACLFKAYGEKEDSHKLENITISLVREARPLKLFKYLEAHGSVISNPYKGIYYVTGGIALFPVQIIVTRELGKEKHRWLCSLSGKLNEYDLKEFLISVSKLTGKMDKEYADSILEVVIKANRELVEKIRSDKNMSKTLLEIMEPVLLERDKEILQQGIEQGKREGKKEGMVYAFYEMNLDTNEIAQKVQLTESEVIEILRHIKDNN